MRSRYRVKEIFYTLQGEGLRAGRPAVFCRFTSCNLWTGREKDRRRAVCTFCDTDFIGTDGDGGGRFAQPEALADAITAAWRPVDDVPGRRLTVLTGGEPLLQVDGELCAALHERGFEIAVETNGTRPVPERIDWVCVSPKADAPVVVEHGDELKLVYPQEKALPERFTHLPFDHFLLQPMDGPDLAANTQAAVAYCKDHPQWQLSLQTHKYLGIP